MTINQWVLGKKKIKSKKISMGNFLLQLISPQTNFALLVRALR